MPRGRGAGEVAGSGDQRADRRLRVAPDLALRSCRNHNRRTVVHLSLPFDQVSRLGVRNLVGLCTGQLADG